MILQLGGDIAGGALARTQPSPGPTQTREPRSSGAQTANPTPCKFSSLEIEDYRGRKECNPLRPYED